MKEGSNRSKVRSLEKKRDAEASPPHKKPFFIIIFVGMPYNWSFYHPKSHWGGVGWYTVVSLLYDLCLWRPHLFDFKVSWCIILLFLRSSCILRAGQAGLIDRRAKTVWPGDDIMDYRHDLLLKFFNEKPNTFSLVFLHCIFMCSIDRYSSNRILTTY